MMCALLQRAVDRAEHGIQVAAEPIDDGNDRKRNSRCDQSVFNGSSATFVGEELYKNRIHVSSFGFRENVRREDRFCGTKER